MIVKVVLVAFSIFLGFVGIGVCGTISAVSGSLNKDNIVEITGESFGVRSNFGGGAGHLNRFWDDFEDGDFKGWSFWSNGASWVMSPSIIRNNSKFTAHKTNKDALDAMTISASSSNFYYISFYMYLPSSYVGNGNDKYFRLGSTQSNSNAVWGSGHLTLEFSPCGVSSKSYGSIPARNGWHFVEVMSALPVLGSSENYVEVYLNGTMVNKTQCSSPWPVEEVTKSPYISIGTWFNSTGGIGGGWYFDDFYADYTKARVVLGNKSTYAESTQREMQIPTAWSNNKISVKFNSGAFSPGDTAFLYVIDANGNVSPGRQITIGGSSSGGATPPPPTDSAPSIAISSPTSASTFTTSTSLVTIAGSASDDKGISTVTWSSTLGGSGTATNLSGNWTSWQIANLALSQGNNPITVTVTDTAGQKTYRTLTITYSPTAQLPPPPSGTKVWDAVSQNGDSAWKSSTVTYTVRLLVKGSVLAQGGNQVRLGFQGRSSGNYTIRKVSIAQRDLNAPEGDVVDATWTRVTFDGQSATTWGSDVVTVPAGQEKFSDPIAFPLMAGQDYYVTFKIDSPSVYLNPPTGYRELYFQSADRTDDIDWSGNGHGVTQDYHALGVIMAEGQAPVKLTAPGGLRLVQVQ